jgi:rRNA maturation RNase YbeY
LRKSLIKNWIKEIIRNNGKIAGDLNIIFMSDDQLLEMNRNYLRHNYYTDIITFNYNSENKISGDICISTDRVSENSILFNSTFEGELHRVIIHGILHLLGYDDKSTIQKQKMRELEDDALRNFPGISQ